MEPCYFYARIGQQVDRYGKVSYETLKSLST